MEDNVAAILCHGRTDTGIKQFLDLADQFVVTFGRGAGTGCGIRILIKNRLTRGVMLHDPAENLGLQGLPVFGVVFGDGDEITAQKDTGDAINFKQFARQRRFYSFVAFDEVCCAKTAHNLFARQEFERRGVRGRFGLNEHGCLSSHSDCRGECAPARQSAFHMVSP